MRLKIVAKQRVLLICLLSLLIVSSFNAALSIKAKQIEVSSEDKAALLLLSNKDSESIKTINRLIKTGGNNPACFPPIRHHR